MKFTRAKSWEEFQERAASAFASLERNPLYDAQLLEDVELDGASTTLVAHKLGRKVRGFVVAKKDTSAVIYWDLTDTADLTKSLPLFADAIDTVASILVF